ncbi:hypothetical protein [Rubritalea tangerina]|uniref:hypothetical protein n=1 Tax=Rubritalea tangerina TaxID=430798 RepID=UPI00361B1134
MDARPKLVYTHTYHDRRRSLSSHYCPDLFAYQRRVSLVKSPSVISSSAVLTQFVSSP